MSSNKKLLVIPHVGKSGGAGIYNADLINALNKMGNVSVAGEFSSEYVDVSKRIYTNALKNRLVFPNYDGVSILGKLYWLLCSFIGVLHLFKDKANTIKFLESFDVIFLTSSIQIPYAYFLKKLGFKGIILCVVQENLKLEGGFGFLVTNWLKSVDLIIGITKEWCSYANSRLIKTELLANQFKMNEQTINENPEYDAIYVGGESKLKGIDHILKLFEDISHSKRIKIIMLGVYTDSFINKVSLINSNALHNGSELIVGGYVTNIQTYLADSKVLLMPIAAPHFCRPAIEAGFCNRTFIVPDYEELSEFVLPEYNSLTYTIGSFQDFKDKFIYLLDNPKARQILEVNNNIFVCENYNIDDYNLNLANIYSNYIA
jgi:glycosyltransferase involved in cell wall biosynthesis